MNKLFLLQIIFLLSISCGQKRDNPYVSDYYRDLTLDTYSDSVTMYEGEIVDTLFFEKVDSIISNFIKFEGDTVYLAFSYNELQYPQLDTIPISKDKSFYVLAQVTDNLLTHDVICKTGKYVFSIREDQANIFTRNTRKKVRIKKPNPYKDVNMMFSRERLAVSVYYAGELEYMDRDYYVDLYRCYYE